MAEITERSFPFDSEEVDGNFDREYIADDFARYFRAFISSGVFMRTSTNLQVIANGDMTVTLKSGNIIIEGYRYELENDLVIQLDPADGVANRIDRVCITWSKSDRDIHYTLQKGELAHVPVAVSVRRTAEYKDYAVADIYVEAGAISLTQTAITDQRLNSEVCGLATPFADFDTTTLYNKIEAYYSEMQKKTENWTKEEQDKFTVWFGGIRDQLSGDIGANLQLQIGVLKSLTTADRSSLVAAINEINDPLDTLEEIEANTDAGRFAGALAVKEINSNLSERINSGLSDIDVRYNAETGAPEWSPRGADTWSPFSSGKAKAELLWTNSNPSTGFPAQTVNFKENTYSHYIIFFYGRHNIHANPCTAFIESNYTAPGGYFGVKGTGCYYVAGQVSVSRNITATTNKSITFSQGYPSNDYIVPYSIYGANIEL